MPGTTTTIDREQREGLYELLRNHLGGIGDVWVALEQEEDFATAERLAIEYGEDFRLLADIGWALKGERKSFELTMPSEDLTELLGRLAKEAESVLDGSTCMQLMREEEERARARYERAKQTCAELMARLDPERS